MQVVDGTNFKSEVLDSKIPVVVDFYAQWCPPCKMFAPIFEKVGGKLNGKAKFVKMDVDTAIEIAKQYEVMSIPTTMIFKNGKPIGSILGAHAEEDFENWVLKSI